MNEERLRALLDGVARGGMSVDDAVGALKGMPFDDLGFVKMDTHRELRQGFPEVIFAAGKTPTQIISILEEVDKRGENVLVTRLAQEAAAEVRKVHAKAEYNADARVMWINNRPVEKAGRGVVLVVTAGTSDIPVAEEAAITAEFMGNEVERVIDVGVAGIHRLFHHFERLTAASVIIVVAGMEGALPSVVGGLVDKPVIAVPTSVGYGTSFGGITALLGMLNSCASGVCVVNIDNGFGAGCVASLINRV